MASSRQSWLAEEGRFAALYRDNAAELLVYLARRVWDPQVAMDLAAEAFAEALSNRDRFKGSHPAAARSWLYGIAANKLSRFFRDGAIERRALSRLGLESPDLSQGEHERVEELAGIEELRTGVKSALREISEDQRLVLELRIVQEATYGEIAERLGVSEQTARARVSRGLRSLARVLERTEPAMKGIG